MEAKKTKLTGAERAARHKKVRASLPTMAQLGFPHLDKPEFSETKADILATIEAARSEAAELNAEMKAIVQTQPDGTKRKKALKLLNAAIRIELPKF